jgi:capsular exopolysaccharide synthesis family protein
MNSTHDTQILDRDNGQYNDDPQVSALWEYVAILRRGKWVILLTLLAVSGLVALYSFTRKPVYEASALVLIDMKGKSGALPTFDITGTATANKITNELEILKSQSTAHDVADALRSRAFLRNGKSTPIPIVAVEEEEERKDSLAAIEEVMERLSTAVEFTPVRESDIIKITARSTDPREAALIANVYTDIYTTRNLNASRLRSKSVREFLQSQLQSKKTTLDTAETDLQNYMRSSGVVSLDSEEKKVVEQLSQLEAQRDGIEVEKSSRQKTLSSYRQELARLEPGSAKEMGEANDSYIRLLQDQIAKLEVQHDVVVAQNPELINQKIYSDKLTEINQQIEVLKENLKARTQQYLSSMMPGTRVQGEGTGSFLAEAKQKIIEQQIELQGLDARKIALDGVIRDYEIKFNQIPKKSIELAKLQRSRLSSEKLYLLVEEKFNESAINEKSEFGYVDVIDPAVVPVKPVSPRVFLNLIIGCFLGLGLGVGIVFVRAGVDARIRTPEDVKRQGFVPLSSISRMDGEIKKIEQDLRSRVAKRGFDPHLVSFYRPTAPIAESYRHLRTNVQRLQADKPVRCIILTSANAGDGKTTTVCNLAISLAQDEKKVLLVNADLRNPMIHISFALKNEKGLASLLSGTATFDEALQRRVLENLDIIASGELPRNPSELLGSKKMKEFIEHMKEKYDYVLFDAPPLLAVTDATVLATEVDAVLIVASAGITKATALRSVAEFLLNIGVNMIGVVLNNFNRRDAYGRYSSDYLYGYYGYESGYYGANNKKKKTKHSRIERLETQHQEKRSV